MARKVITIKPIDAQGEKPDRPSDEVQWEDLQNAWFDEGVMKKRPALAAAAHTTLAATCTASPVHQVLQFRHPVAVDADNTERANGAGDNTNWTPVGQASNYLCLNSVYTIDTSYVEHDTINEKDSYAFSNTSLTVVDRLRLRIRALRSRYNTYKMQLFCRNAADTEANIGSPITVTFTPGDADVWEDYYVTVATDPITSAAWTAANVNAYEFGFYISELNAGTFVEYLDPTGDGADSDWTIVSDDSHATYYELLAAQNALVSETGISNAMELDEYIFTRTDDEKMSFTFTEGRPFSTVTNVELEVWEESLYGNRKVEVYLDDSGTETIYGTFQYTALKPHAHSTEETDPSNFAFYADYVTSLDTMAITKEGYVDASNNLLDADTAFGTDPVSDSAWDTSTLYTYEWVVKATSTWTCITMEEHQHPYAITVLGSGYPNVGYYVDGSLIYTHTYANSGPVSGNELPVSMDGTYYGTKVEDYDSTPVWHDLFQHPAGNWYWRQLSNGTISQDFALYLKSPHAASTAATQFTLADVYSTRWVLVYAPFYIDTTADSADYFWLHGTIGSYALGLQATRIIGSGSYALWVDRNFYDPQSPGSNPYDIGADGWTETLKYGETVGFFSQYYDGNLSYVNTYHQSGSYTRGSAIYDAATAIRVWLYPQPRVYGARLKLTGTAVATPQISMFSITAEGATSTARRQSKLMVSSTDIQRYDDVATLVDVIGSSTNPSADITIRFDTCKFYGKQYFTNGINYIYRYPNGSNEVDELDTVHLANTISTFIGRLFTGGTTESATYFPDRVRWCIIADDSDWTGSGSGYIDLDDTDGEVLMTEPLGGTLVGYKDTSIYNLHPTGDRDNPIVKQLLSPGVGVLAPSSVKAVVNREGLPAHIFLGQGRGGVNVYMYTGNMLIPIGDDIKQELRDNMSARQRKNAFAEVDYKRNQYLFYVCYEGETFPMRAWTYDIDTGVWKTWDLPNPVTCAGTWETTEADTNVEEWTMLYGGEDALVRWPDPEAFQDFTGTNVMFVAESGDYAAQGRTSHVTVYRVNLYYYDKGYTPVKVSASVDGGDTWSDRVTRYIGQADASADGSLRMAQFDLIKTGRRFRIKIEHDANAELQLTEVQVEIEEQGWIV